MCKFSKQSRVTLFSQLSKESEGKPGPGTYNKEKSGDYFYKVQNVPKR